VKGKGVAEKVEKEHLEMMRFSRNIQAKKEINKQTKI
jgi:hypothetical protein